MKTNDTYYGEVLYVQSGELLDVCNEMMEKGQYRKLLCYLANYDDGWESEITDVLKNDPRHSIYDCMAEESDEYAVTYCRRCGDSFTLWRKMKLRDFDRLDEVYDGELTKMLHSHNNN